MKSSTTLNVMTSRLSRNQAARSDLRRVAVFAASRPAAAQSQRGQFSSRPSLTHAREAGCDWRASRGSGCSPGPCASCGRGRQAREAAAVSKAGPRATHDELFRLEHRPQPSLELLLHLVLRLLGLRRLVRVFALLHLERPEKRRAGHELRVGQTPAALAEISTTRPAAPTHDNLIDRVKVADEYGSPELAVLPAEVFGQIDVCRVRPRRRAVHAHKP